MLDELTDFDIIPEYKFREVEFHIVASDGAEPVARIAPGKYGNIGNVHKVYAGPRLDTFAGVISRDAALDKDGAEIGRIEYRNTRRTSLGDVMVFRQNGMTELVGEQMGVFGKIRSLPLLGILDSDDLVGSVSHLRYRFRDKNSPGFEMAKRAGISNKVHFSIHDQKINRLLAFSCFMRLEDDMDSNPKKFIFDIANQFTAEYWREPRRRPSR